MEAGEPNLAEMFAKSMTMVEDVAAIIHESEQDCAAMAEKLEDYHGKNQEFIVRAQSIYDTMPTDERTALQKQYRTRFKAAWAKLRPGVLKCKGNPRVVEISEALWSGT